MEGAIARAGSRMPAFVEIAGEAGIGKSELLRELADRADASGHLVLVGRAAEFERDVPFAVVVDALDDWLGSLGHRALDGLGADLDELAVVFPALGGGAGPPEVRPLLERYRMHRAVRALLRALAARQPLVLVLDDLHWADPASVELVSHLLRHGLPPAMLLATAVRPHQTSRALATVLESAACEESATRLAPAALTRDEAETLIGDSLAPPVREEIYRESGGNPFYLVELTRAATRHGQAEPAGLKRTAGDRLGVPTAVEAALAEELASISPESRAIAVAAAVAGEPFEPELVGAIAKRDEEAVFGALEELLETDLVRPTELPRYYRFRHPIVRHAVYESASPPARVAGHELAAAALAAGGASVAVRAHHVERYARRGDSDAIALLTEAAHSISQRAPATAAHWFAAALRLLPDGAEDGQRLGLLLPLAAALGGAGRLEESRDTLYEVVDLLPRELAAERARAIALSAKIEHLLGRHAEVRPRLLGALDALPAGAAREAAGLEIELASDAFFTGDFEGMLRHAARAAEMAEELGDQPLLAAATALRGGAEYTVSRLGDARRSIERAARLVEGLSDDEVSEHLNAIAWFAWTECFLEHFGDAGRHFDRGLAVARRTGQGHLAILMTAGQSNRLIWQGRIPEAIATAESAVDAALLSGSAPLATWALTVRSWAALVAGDVGGAIRFGEQAVGWIEGLVDVVSAAAGCYLAEARLEAGDPLGCRQQLLEATGGPDLPAIERGFKSRWFEILARAEMELGRLDAAEEWVVRAEGAAAGLEIGGRTADAMRARARLLVARGDPTAAAVLALQAAKAADGADVRIDAARSRILAGVALGEDGDRPRALVELERAQNDLVKMGAPRYGDEAARALRKLGRRVPRPGRRGEPSSGLESLSPREVEVAERVSEGKTNHQIASELFLSDKTIESHMTSIFRKLGVSSRAAVAGVVARAGDPTSA